MESYVPELQWVFLFFLNVIINNLFAFGHTILNFTVRCQLFSPYKLISYVQKALIGEFACGISLAWKERIEIYAVFLTRITL